MLKFFLHIHFRFVKFVGEIMFIKNRENFNIDILIFLIVIVYYITLTYLYFERV